MNKHNDIDNEKALNLILEWGKTKLLSPHLIKFCDDIAECCMPLLESDKKELCNFFSNEISKLGNEVNFTIATLNDIELATSTEKDEEFWDTAKSGFEVFNEVNYLTKALHSLIHGHIDEEDYIKLANELDAISSHITDWMEEGDFSPLRFVVLNKMRRTRLSQIPEEERYQFPWYEVYAEYPDSTVELITKDLDDYLSGSWDRLKETVPPEYLCEASYELKRDVKLFSAIDHMAQDIAFVTAFLEEPSPSRLLSIGHSVNENVDYPLPDIVAEIGVKEVRDKLLADVSIVSGTDALLLKFLNAFCGPGLDENKRLECLNEVEEKIEGIEMVSNEGDKDVLRNLQLWFKGECDDRQMTDSAFKSWFGKMEKKAVEIDAESFNEHFKLFANTLHGAKEFCKEHVSQELQFQSHVAEFADNEQVQDVSEINIKQNPIEISVNLNIEESSYIMPLSDSDSISASDGYIDLWKHLENVHGWYWGGACFAKGNEKEIFPLKRIVNRSLKKIDGSKGYRFSVIGLSNNKKDLGIFVNKLKSGSFTEKSKRTYPVDVSRSRVAEEVRDYTQKPLHIVVLIIKYTYNEE